MRISHDTQKGKDLLLKLDSNGAGSFATTRTYKGHLELEPSPEGGLRARLELPAA